MSGNSLPATIQSAKSLNGGKLSRILRDAVIARLQGLRVGSLTLVDAGEQWHFGVKGHPLSAVIQVQDPRCYIDIALGGTIGAGEAYMQGYWSCDDLTRLVRILLRNRETLDGMETGLARLAQPAYKLYHWLNRNTHDGSQRNIAAHYDLGNDFFELFLDETMMYSSAIFRHENATLYEASLYKLDHICQKLDLKPSDHVIEIGSGWGGFAIHAASHYGCRVTTTTISREQYRLACERVEQAGLSNRVTVLLKDYRELTGQYDKLVSIEMIEAVGHQYYKTFFSRCADLLKPDGMMLLQAITIADQQYETAKHSVDFIQRYIFPGSCIPSNTALLQAITAASNLRLFDLEDIGPHYATTLRHWRNRFFNNIDEVRRLGYPEHFIRMWEFYFCYCEGGFTERAISDVHMLLTKPACRRDPLV